ncbi:MAG: membrane integrity-associated transporter subunit PqiC, partial [Acetobacteraceae bacterium]|nr:membrane integrity-associated transporter subunit PqiC [Acetobacteraceae bacterium]
MLLSGCALLSPQQGASTKAMLSKLPASVPHERQHGESLLILPPQAGEAFDTTRMAYTVRPYQLAYFRDNEWAEPPTQMIQTLLVQTLEATGFFRSVLTPPETTHNLSTLDTAILNLVQD